MFNNYLSSQVLYLDDVRQEIVESNVSRIARICWKYHIPPRELFKKYFGGGGNLLGGYFEYEVAASANSYTRKSSDINRIINELSGKENDVSCCYEIFSGILDGNARTFISKSKQWCPKCYMDRGSEANKNNVGIFDDLYWSVDAIKTCMVHGVHLFSRCYHCASKQPYLSVKVEPGYCNSCKRFLGSNFCHKVDPAVVLKQKEFFSIFYNIDYGKNQISQSVFMKNFRAIKSVFPEATRPNLSRLMGCSQDMIKHWYFGTTKPQLRSLFDLCNVLGLSGPHQLFWPTEEFLGSIVLSRNFSMNFDERVGSRKIRY